MTQRNELNGELTVEETAELLGKKRRTVERYLAAGILPRIKYFNGAVRVPREAAEALLVPIHSPSSDASPASGEGDFCRSA